MRHAHKQVIDVVRRVSPKIRASLVMFTYFNPIMRRGAEQFCRDIKEAGGLRSASHFMQHSTNSLKPMPPLSKARKPNAVQDVRFCNDSRMQHAHSPFEPSRMSSAVCAGLLVPDTLLEEEGPVMQVHQQQAC